MAAYRGSVSATPVPIMAGRSRRAFKRFRMPDWPTPLPASCLPGPVCLTRTASVGYVTILAQLMATSQDFATWTCTEALLPEYLMFSLMAEGDDIRKFGMGSTHTTIYFPEIRAFHIALPPVAEQQQIVDRDQHARMAGPNAHIWPVRDAVLMGWLALVASGIRLGVRQGGGFRVSARFGAS